MATCFVVRVMLVYQKDFVQGLKDIDFLNKHGVFGDVAIDLKVKKC